LARRWLQQTAITENDENYYIPESFKILNNFFNNNNSSIELNKFEIYVKNELNNALNIFKKHKWIGHVIYLEHCISTLEQFIFFLFFLFLERRRF
jgi:hypothetical protein